VCGGKERNKSGQERVQEPLELKVAAKNNNWKELPQGKNINGGGGVEEPKKKKIKKVPQQREGTRGNCARRGGSERGKDFDQAVRFRGPWKRFFGRLRSSSKGGGPDSRAGTWENPTKRSVLRKYPGKWGGWYSEEKKKPETEK